MQTKTSFPIVEARWFPVVVLLIGLGIGLFHVFVVPPFQGPDEVQHFLYSAAHATDKTTIRHIEAQTLQLLKQSKWFHFVGIGPGWENIRRISDIPFVFHFDPDKASSRNTAFHLLYGKILQLSGIKDPLSAFYFLRLISTFFYLVFLMLVFYFFKRHFPGRWVVLFTGLLVVFQLGTIMNAVNYDVLMVLVGSLFFMGSFRYLYFGKSLDFLFLMLLAAAAVLIKLTGFIFLIYLLLLPVLRIKPRPGSGIKWLQYPAMTLIVLILAFGWLNYLLPERFFTLYSQLAKLWNDLSVSLTAQGEKALNAGFFNSMIDSFYFCTGWMGFKLNAAWYIAIKVFLAIAAIGLLMALFFKKMRAAVLEKKWLLYTGVALALQVFATWLYYGHMPLSQGRYVYPLILPAIVIVYSGLTIVERGLGFKRAYLVLSFILFQVVLWVFAAARILTVYYMEIASPHPGL
ncbi:MAG: hypothetical protein ACM3SY_03735 [Candidatus Omnitrophota bacterium]